MVSNYCIYEIFGSLQLRSMSINRLLLKLLLGFCAPGPSGQGLERVLNVSPRLVALDPALFPPATSLCLKPLTPTLQPAGWTPTMYVWISQNPMSHMISKLWIVIYIFHCYGHSSRVGPAGLLLSRALGSASLACLSRPTFLS